MSFASVSAQHIRIGFQRSRVMRSNKSMPPIALLPKHLVNARSTYCRLAQINQRTYARRPCNGKSRSPFVRECMVWRRFVDKLHDIFSSRKTPAKSSLLLAPKSNNSRTKSDSAIGKPVRALWCVPCIDVNIFATLFESERERERASVVFNRESIYWPLIPPRPYDMFTTNSALI